VIKRVVGALAVAQLLIAYPKEGLSAQPNPVIVFVHGRGQDDKDRPGVQAAFVDTFRVAQRRWLGREIIPATAYAFVWYADLIAPAVAQAPSAGACAFAQQSAPSVVTDWRDALLGLASSLQLDGPMLRLLTEDTHRYLSSGRTRCETNARLLETISSAQFGDRQLIVVAHSMGGIVSLAALKQNAEQLDSADRFSVIRLVTLGTQVGQPLILKGVYGSFVDPPFPVPSTIREWVNFQNKGDRLAFTARSSFQASDTLRLPRDRAIDTSGDRHAIRSYLNDREVLRAIIAPWCSAQRAPARPPECATVLAGQ
jgi:pimeloyl-ACP methyl ester carboxylesterase